MAICGTFWRMRWMDSAAAAVRKVISMTFKPPASSASASGTASSAPVNRRDAEEPLFEKWFGIHKIVRRMIHGLAGE